MNEKERWEYEWEAAKRVTGLTGGALDANLESHAPPNALNSRDVVDLAHQVSDPCLLPLALEIERELHARPLVLDVLEAEAKKAKVNFSRCRHELDHPQLRCPNRADGGALFCEHHDGKTLEELRELDAIPQEETS